MKYGQEVLLWSGSATRQRVTSPLMPRFGCNVSIILVRVQLHADEAISFTLKTESYAQMHFCARFCQVARAEITPNAQGTENFS